MAFGQRATFGLTARGARGALARVLGRPAGDASALSLRPSRNSSAALQRNCPALWWPTHAVCLDLIFVASRARAPSAG